MDISFRKISFISNTNSKSKLYESPILLNQKQSDGVQEVINHFEDLLGHSENEYDASFIFSIFSDVKIGKGIIHVLLKYFYELKGLDKVVNSKEIFIKYRRKLYQVMEHHNISWALADQQEQLVREIGETQESLFADHSINFKIIRKVEEPPLVLEVISVYNREVIKYLVGQSYYIEFTLPEIVKSGTLIKNVIRYSKFLGIESDIIKINSQVIKITLLGPNELIGKNIIYSFNLFILLQKIALELQQTAVEVDFLIQTKFYELRKEIVIRLLDILSLSQGKNIENSGGTILFDSKIEKEFSEKFTARYKHWSLQREPGIVEKKIIMIPDFLLQYHSQKFYLEIVGFWTERYISKKVQKLNLLKREYPNMLLLVDKALNFPKIEGLASFYYTRKHIPILEIGSFLRKFEKEEFLVYYNTLPIRHWVSLIVNLVRKKNLLQKKGIYEIIQTSTDFDLINILKRMHTEYLKDEGFIIILDPLNVTTCYYVKAFQQKLESLSSPSFTVTMIHNLFPDLSEKLIRKLLSILGYKFKFRSLLEESIILPKKKKEISPVIYR